MSQISGQADNHKTDEMIPSNQWGSDIEVESGLVRQNLLEVENDIALYNTKIIAVTKYYGCDAIVKAYNAGVRNFGESRANESVDKIQALPEEIRQSSIFHFIGHLQTNKAEKVVKHFDYIHSVDSLKLAKVISDVACGLNKREKVLLQVNNANEIQKFGYDEVQLKEDMSEILGLKGIEVVGLMNMAPLAASESELRTVFSGLRRLRDELQEDFRISLPELSMGMSNDYKIAVSEGATFIRIGRKLFN